MCGIIKLAIFLMVGRSFRHNLSYIYCDRIYCVRQ